VNAPPPDSQWTVRGSGRWEDGMRLAIMQPYFFPYIGYFQLISAADAFILFDDVQYIRHGWINRNRIHDPNKSWQYITAPLEKHEHTDLIRNLMARSGEDWSAKIVSQVQHYKRRAPYFEETVNLVASLLAEAAGDSRISRINLVILRGVCRHLGIDRPFQVSSDCGFDYRNVHDAGEWALRISEQVGAKEYINPVSGAALFDPAKFAASGIKLSFLQPEEIVYSRRGPFEPWLSIIDVLMFNGVAGTRQLLDRYSLLAHPGVAAAA